MSDFADAIIHWQRQYGRHDLPWQNTSDPYAIWISEIMLQQTQVTAVINYYAKFMQRFPTIATLAIATQDEVLQYWSGLGYYSRARNLHSVAQKITDDFAGVFPQGLTEIVSLPGIGRSTAAAISTFAFNKPAPILDGNVKRVFARHFLVEGWPGTPKIERKMWEIAEHENPSVDAISYTQGLMDLGATLCTRSNPKCNICPVNSTCLAFANKVVNTLPTPKPRKVLPEKTTAMLVIFDGAEVMLEKRPNKGIWGGLWSFPEVVHLKEANHIAETQYDSKIDFIQQLAVINHTFTHFKLKITPLMIQTSKKSTSAKIPNTIWLPLNEALTAAIPTPIRNILLNVINLLHKKTAT